MSRYLEVGLEILKYGEVVTERVELPDNWDEMSAREQEEWARDACEVHVTNYVGSWTEVKED